MTGARLAESVVEQAALGWLRGLGYSATSGPEIAPGEPQAERDDYSQVVLARRLRLALHRLNPRIRRGAARGSSRSTCRSGLRSLI